MPDHDRSEEPVKPVAPIRRRWRFSLRTLMLFGVVIALAVSHLATSWRLKHASEENEKLRGELGYLTIDDPGKVHAIQVPTVESMLWKWRLHVPAGRSCSMHVLTHDIPEQGYPEHSTTGFSAPEDPFTLTIGIRRDHRGEWQLVASELGGTMRMPVPENSARWLVKNDGYVSRGVGVGDTYAFDMGKPVELLRLRVLDRKAGGGSSPPQGPSQGLLIWLEVK